MKTFRSHLKEKFRDKNYEKQFFRGLEKTRIATEIAFFREKAGFTQDKLATLAGTSQSAIARLENPNYQHYSLKTLRKIAEALNLELVVSYREKEKTQYESLPKIFVVASAVWQDKGNGFYFQEKEVG
jgi:transcriptional regulator with XRE-family HTH domain